MPRSAEIAVVMSAYGPAREAHTDRLAVMSRLYHRLGEGALATNTRNDETRDVEERDTHR